jgi:hypothetical protein
MRLPPSCKYISSIAVFGYVEMQAEMHVYLCAQACKSLVETGRLAQYAKTDGYTSYTLKSLLYLAAYMLCA